MRALELDSSLSEAHVARGLVATYYDWDLPTAEASFREAIRLNPNHPDAYEKYAHLLIWLDTRFAEAVEQINRAVELDPLDPRLQAERSNVHCFNRDFEAAIAAARETVVLAPRFDYGVFVLGHALTLAGRVAEGLGHIEHAIELDGRNVHYVSWLGINHAIAGRRSDARAILAELDDLEREGRSVWAWKLSVHAALGECERVMEGLERAVEERSASLVFLITHPLVDCVREDPRFAELVSRMGLPHLASYRPAEAWHPSRIN